MAQPFLTIVGAPSLTQFYRGKGGRPGTFCFCLGSTVTTPTLRKKREGWGTQNDGKQRTLTDQIAHRNDFCSPSACSNQEKNGQPGGWPFFSCWARLVVKT